MPDRDELVLFFNKDSKLRLAKNGFTVGNCDAFLDFVRAKYPHLL